ncbi:sugar O-acetyltransferase [Alteribacillus sp. HJP-4]|uniref:sugar O-acetyltransferase n=1 Tax=Alteribacillus sp. HJP-4 TaxID=2775394 RepID=UPI0035CD1CB3
MTEKEKMLSGELYQPWDKELVTGREEARKLTKLFNDTTGGEYEKQAEILMQLFGKTGEDIHIEPDFRCDYGFNIHTGKNFFANFNCVFLDVCEVSFGDNVMLGPGVHIYTATHPLSAQVRNRGLENGRPVRIGDNVWIGGGAIINPGVSIGDNTVIGSGSVVTKDVPAAVFAAGNPCKVIKKID